MPQIIANSTATTPPSSLNRLNQTGTTSRLTTGQKINGASDDAATTANQQASSSIVRISNAAQTISKLENQANAAKGVASMAQTARSALGSTNSALQDLRDLAMEAANGTTTADRRAAIATEAGEKLKAIDTIATNTQYEGKTLLDGSFSQKVDMGNGETEISIGDMSSKGLGLEGLDLSTEKGAFAAINKIVTAQDTALVAEASIGRTQNQAKYYQGQIDATISGIGEQAEERAASQAAEAGELANSSQTRTLQQTGLGALQGAQAFQSVLALFR